MLTNFNKRNPFNSDFGRNVITLFTGTTIAQIIPFIASPILTRLYSPEDFGLLALFTSTFSLISIIATLQYESAIVLPEKEEDAISIVGLCLLITICISLITIILVVSLNGTITDLLGNNKIAFWLYFIPIPIFFSGLSNTINNWASRQKKFKHLSIRTISQSASTAGVKLALGFKGATSSGLILGTLVGQSITTSAFAWVLWKEDKTIFKKVSKGRILKSARKYKNFPKYTAWQGFFDMFNASGTIFIISAFFGSQILGLYSFTIGLLQRPLLLIGSSVAQVYYQKASELHNTGESIWRITRKIMIRLSLISFLIFLPVAITGPRLFTFVFGNDWFDAGIYARLLIPWLAIRFIVSPVSYSANILGKQKLFFFVSLVFNITFPTLLLIAFKIGLSFNFALFFVSLFSGIYFLFVIYWIKKITSSEKNHSI